MVFRTWTGVIKTAFTKGQQHLNVHIMFYRALAGKAEFSQVALGFQLLLLGIGHGLRFPGKELYPAGRTTSITSAAVQGFSTEILKR
jgi:hypothetical protein